MISKVVSNLFAVLALVALGLVAAASPASAQTVLTACGSLATGNYILATNITTSGDCFVITGDNVAIDFKGHTIIGDGTGNGITDNGFRHFAGITNGKIRNFGNGIFLHGCCHGINKMDVSQNTAIGIHIGDCCSTVNAVTANDNGGDGMQLEDCCYVTTGSQAQRNGGRGIFMDGCCSFLNHVTASNNAGTGMEFFSDDYSVVDSQINQNGGEGIHIDNCCNGVTSSTVTKNVGNGIRLEDCCNLVTATKSNSNGGIGMSFPSSDDQVVMNSQAIGNTTGVALNCGSVVIGLTANKNSTANLTESGGDCTNINNKAP